LKQESIKQEAVAYLARNSGLVVVCLRVSVAAAAKTDDKSSKRSCGVAALQLEENTGRSAETGWLPFDCRRVLNEVKMGTEKN